MHRLQAARVGLVDATSERRHTRKVCALGKLQPHPELCREDAKDVH